MRGNPISKYKRERIWESIQKGNLKHTEIAAKHNIGIATVSKIKWQKEWENRKILDHEGILGFNKLTGYSETQEDQRDNLTPEEVMLSCPFYNIKELKDKELLILKDLKYRL